MTIQNKINEIKEHAIECLTYEASYDPIRFMNEDLHDLHHRIFNESYYIVGYYNCTKWMGSDAFECIQIVKEYEQDNFGTCTTDLGDSEQVCNMFVYIIGERIMQEALDHVMKIPSWLNEEEEEEEDEEWAW
tara:strand:+ start:1668 stop:2063 length:396 start_codon:yes stop_codon:yes gene_type:complete